MDSVSPSLLLSLSCNTVKRNCYRRGLDHDKEKTFRVRLREIQS